MHEYGVTEEIVNIVLDKIKEHDNQKVEKINIILGKLTDFAPESIEYYFSFISKGTPAENARLSFKKKDIIFLCKHCKKEFKGEEMLFSCPECDGNDLDIISGKEFYIESIEVNNGKN